MPGAAQSQAMQMVQVPLDLLAHLLAHYTPGGCVPHGPITGTSNIQHSTANSEAEAKAKLQVGNGDHLSLVMTEFQKQLAAMRGEMQNGFAAVGTKLETVANVQGALRRENAELRQLNAEGHLNFAVRVNGDDFLAFAVIMALGNRKAAAEHLKIPHRSFYDRVNRWARGSQDQQRMFRLTEWRKKTGRKIVVRLEDSVQSGEPNDAPENPVTMAAVLEGIAASDSRDYPAILREILEVLAQQNAKNWEAMKGEALQIIKEELN